MIKREGYVVVQKSRESREASFNPRYHGIDRLVPFLWENYEKGFKDPYLDPRIASDVGLIYTLALAQEAFHIYTQIVASEELEILLLRERSGDLAGELLVEPGMKFLGFDVAGDRPFYSLVADFPIPEEGGPIQAFRRKLNEHGLFDSVEIAKEYFDMNMDRYPENRDQGIVIWEVYLISQDP